MADTTGEQIVQIRHQVMLEGIVKFRLFFVGLVFAVLAFSVQFSVHSSNLWVKLLQGFSWLLLIITGILALVDTGGFVTKYTEKVFEGLGAKGRWAMWAFFLLAIVLLGISRFIS